MNEKLYFFSIYCTLIIIHLVITETQNKPRSIIRLFSVKSSGSIVVNVHSVHYLFLCQKAVFLVLQAKSSVGVGMSVTSCATMCTRLWQPSI